MQRAVVNTHTHVDRAALVNSGAVVDHDSVVCAGAHVGLGSVVKGEEGRGRRSNLLYQKKDRRCGQQSA